MSRKPVDFTDSIRKNLAYDNVYGQHKNVHAPHWTGDEGDKAALMRGSFPTPRTMAYFNGSSYMGQYRNYATTALQGKGRTIYDKVELTGQEDFDTSGRNSIQYKEVSMEKSGASHQDMLIAVGILAAVMIFIAVTK